jgi:hypothetical protein
LARRADVVEATSVVAVARPESSNGKVVWGQNTGSNTVDTPESSRQVHTQSLAVEVMGGGGAKASPTCSKRSPRELKPRRGARREQG